MGRIHQSVKNTLNQKSLQLLYNSIFHCHLLYAVHIWTCSSSGPIIDLFKLQRAAIRIISKTSYNSHTEPLLKKLEILPLPDLISFAKILFMHRFVQKFLPASFNDTWYYNSVRNIGENEIQLRNHLQINLQHSNLARLDIFPWYNFPKLWHTFPDEQIKIIRKIPEFDRKLKHYFINDLSSTVDCSRLLPVLNNRFFSSPHQFSSCVRASVKMVVPGPLRSLPRFFFHMSVYNSGSVFAPFLLKFADSRKSRNS